MLKRRAFTLIETLVVVAIIGLLVSIIMPSISEARRLSKKTACLHNLHQIGVGIQSYLQHHRDTFPYACRTPSVEPQVAADEGRDPYPTMMEVFSRELGKKSEVFACPADRNTKTPGGGRHFDTEGTSYEWNALVINGVHRQPKKLLLVNLVLRPLPEVQVVYDFEEFHGGPKRRGSRNILFADLRVDSSK
jgi:prepilin-type N-terminal cleavage/methylation domain-containing protein